MKLHQLRALIKEEVSKLLLEYEQSVIRKGDKLFVVDDEGNEEFYDEVEGSDYEWLQDGQGAPLERGSSFSSRGEGGYSRGRSSYRYGSRW